MSKKRLKDLVGLALAAKDHWKQFRPKLYRSLVSQGILYDQLYEAGEQANKYIQKATSEGMDYHAAKEVALRTWIHLPDLEQEPEEQALPEQTTA
jgi:hypothetical protein